MWLIISLIIVGVLLLVAELILLPGLSVAGICAFISYVGAVWIAFERFGPTAGIIVICAVAVLSVVATIVSLRAKTWQRLSLKQNIDGTSQQLPQERIKEGDTGVALTRLAPIGKVEINGEVYEGKSLGDVYIDPGKSVEVAGFENFSIIVKIIDN